MQTPRQPNLPPDWISRLSARFLEIARGRVGGAEAEDIVQEALTVICERTPSVEEDRLVDGLPPLAWCFQVLRFTIANHYRRRRTRAGVISDDDVTSSAAATGANPLEALVTEERVALVRAALDSMDKPCVRYLEQLATGIRPSEIAARERIPGDVLYRRIYRCRKKLMRLLVEKGVMR